MFGKLTTGAFRVGAAKQLVLRALARVAGVPVGDIAQHLVGDWTPAPSFWEHLRGAGRGIPSARIGRIHSYWLTRWMSTSRRWGTLPNGSRMACAHS